MLQYITINTQYIVYHIDVVHIVMYRNMHQ